MTVNLSRLRQSNTTGLKQVSAAPFVAAGQNFAQLGKDIQNLGIAGADYLSKQQALQNDNDTNLGLQKFTKDLNESLFDAEFGKVVDFETGQRQLQNPGTIAVDTVKRLQQKQAEIAKTIPSVRQGKFLNATDNQILQAQVKTATIGNTRIKEQAKKLDIEFKNDFKSFAGQLNPEELARGQQSYEQRLARGVATDTYGADDAAKLLAVFKEDVADSVENHKTSVMFQGEPTVKDVRQRVTEIAANPNLNPKEKDARVDSVWRRSGEEQRQRQKSLEALADKKDQEARNWLATKLVDSRLDRTGKHGIRPDDIKYAIENLGLRHPATIKKYTELGNGNEALSQLGEEDNAPAAGYLKDMGQLEIKAITKGWTTPALLKEIDLLRDKAQKEYVNDPNKKLTHIEIAQLDDKAASIIKEFKNEGKRNLTASKQSAEKKLRFLFGGTDKAFDDFNSDRNEKVAETISAANLLIDQGDRWDIAVDKVRDEDIVRNDRNKGIQEFRAEEFEAVLKRASGGKLSKNDRLIMNGMIERRNRRIGKITGN